MFTRVCLRNSRRVRFLGPESAELSPADTDDPRAVVWGDSSAVYATASALRSTGRTFDSVGTALRRVTVDDWTGKSADAYEDAQRNTTEDWLGAADVFADAAIALDDYASTIDWAQSRAAEAIALIRSGDPSDPVRTSTADDLVRRARAARDDAANRAVGALDEAAASARTTPRLPAPPVITAEGGALRINGTPVRAHLVGGFVAGAAATVRSVRGLNPFDPYVLTHPTRLATTQSDLLAGAVSSVVHPQSVVEGLAESFRRDPAEAAGRVAFDIAVGLLGGGSVSAPRLITSRHTGDHDADGNPPGQDPRTQELTIEVPPESLPRKVDASWEGERNYRHGGRMTAMEHVMLRHGPDTAWPESGRFAAGTTPGDIERLVERALREGEIREGEIYGDGRKVAFETDQVVGVDRSRAPTRFITVYTRDGQIMTAFPGDAR